MDQLDEDHTRVKVRLPMLDKRQTLGRGVSGIESEEVTSESDRPPFTPDLSSSELPFSASPSSMSILDRSQFEQRIASTPGNTEDICHKSPKQLQPQHVISTLSPPRRMQSREILQHSKSASNPNTTSKITLFHRLGSRERVDSQIQNIKAPGQRPLPGEAVQHSRKRRSQDRRNLKTTRATHHSKPMNAFPVKSPTSQSPVVRLPHHQSIMSSPSRLFETLHMTHTLSSTSGRSNVDHGRGFSYPASTYKTAGQYDWTSWQELSIKVLDIPPSTTTRDLWNCFNKEGTIVGIELFENTKGQREGKASIRFSPPPSSPIWKNEQYFVPIAAEGIAKTRLHLEAPKRTFKHSSPFDAGKKYPELMVMKASSLNFGMMLNPSTMMNMCTVLPSLGNDIQFRLSLLHREIAVEFLLDIRDQRTRRDNGKGLLAEKKDRQEMIRFRIPLSQLGVIYQVRAQHDQIVLLISLETPPKFFKKLDPAQTHVDDGRYWTEHDAWYRQTDIMYAHSHLKKSPLSLKKSRPVIDLGRWTTYRLMFERSRNPASPFDMIRQALRDYNIDIVPINRLEIPARLEPPVWDFLDKPAASSKGATADLIDLGSNSISQLTFEVRYQLEVCISNGYLNEHNLTRDFVSRLGSMDAGPAQDLLEYVANHQKRVFDSISLFSLRLADGTSLRAKIPKYCVYIRSVTVTPTAVYFQTPVPETSNRVIRQYCQYADRFLRVRFTEEKTEGAIYATNKDTMNEVFTRVKRVLTNGIMIGDRLYEFLACGNAQFREHGAYFFAPLPHLPLEKIRNWMGMFTDIQTVPLYLARLGQCFSTTRAIQSAKTKLQEMEDIQRNGYNFSDGVGKISPLLAHLAASELGILEHLDEPPSVFQIRAGGCKGVVAVWPTLGSTELYIRRSQYKFPAKHDGLEIIRWSQYACANLNRQLILILSALGVPDEVFSQKLRLQLSNLEKAMNDEKTALAILQKDVDHNQMTLVIASMILDGFQKTNEPFVSSLLQLWRAWSIKYLKEKARITIGAGALLLGCVDETGILEGHYNDTPCPPIEAPIHEKARFVPDVFIQISKNAEGKPEVITGPMLLARNPSLHPGDVRVVCGVDIPELRHLKDVVVLPQTGDRDIASMCSGGDLDGDDFLVIWDQDLLPQEWNLEPMDYSRPPMVKHGRSIGIDDLTTFFVTYMKNDTLARIAQAHLANADYLEEGVKDEKCLRLAELHSMAVDYVKTGHPAQMPRDLRPPKRPHFMDNTYQRKENTYISRKILGQLYNQVERVDFVPLFTTPFDERILGAYKADEVLLARASEIKGDYDAHMRRIMAQHEIKTEFEVWSTFVLEHSRTTNDFKFHEQIGQISASLKDQFRNVCYERAGGKTFQQVGPFAAAMYRVTADEMSQAVRECQKSQTVAGLKESLQRMTPATMPLMSFPWLFQDILGKIARQSELKSHGASSDVALNRRAASTTTQIRRAHGHPTIPTRLSTTNDLETADGNTTHVGDVLQLFGDSHIDDREDLGEI